VVDAEEPLSSFTRRESVSIVKYTAVSSLDRVKEPVPLQPDLGPPEQLEKGVFVTRQQNQLP